VIVVGGSTVTVPVPAPSSGFAVGGQILTLAPDGALIGASTTLRPGAVITVGSTTLSIGSSGTIAINGKTTVLPKGGANPTTINIGGYIYSGLAGPGNSTSTGSSTTGSRRPTASIPAAPSETSKPSDAYAVQPGRMGVVAGLIGGLYALAGML